MTLWWDHPRVCGEHVDAQLIQSMSMGSSPRMRGAQPFCFSRQADQGIIPAYAGSTAAHMSMLPTNEDHPRVCGEHHDRDWYGEHRQGSSPRMRGAHLKILAIPTI